MKHDEAIQRLQSIKNQGLQVLRLLEVFEAVILQDLEVFGGITSCVSKNVLVNGALPD